jgi:DNA-binding CsgD family transcriptional regulator
MKLVRRGPHRRGRLSPDDVERLQGASLELHAQPTLEKFRRAVPNVFLRLVPASHFDTSEFVVDRTARRVRMRSCWASTDFITPEFATQAEEALFHHPFMQHTLRYGDTGALMLSDFIPLAKLKRTPLYRELLEPGGAARLLGIVSPGPRGITTLSYARGLREPAFTERERRLFELLAPHFTQARRNVEQRTGIRVNELRAVEHYRLTARELELARWLAKGKTNGEIASILRIHVRTVEKHLERIYEKLGVENRTTAALLLASSPGL